MNELRGQEKPTELDIQTNEYIVMLLDFFERRVTVLLEYFDQYYDTILPLMSSTPDFFYGYFDDMLKIVRYLHNYVFFFYSEIVQGINRFEVVSKELENLTGRD
ncbi:hypothetical protein D3C81_1938330 [compost metagenome]